MSFTRRAENGMHGPLTVAAEQPVKVWYGNTFFFFPHQPNLRIRNTLKKKSPYTKAAPKEDIPSPNMARSSLYTKAAPKKKPPNMATSLDDFWLSDRPSGLSRSCLFQSFCIKFLGLQRNQPVVCLLSYKILQKNSQLFSKTTHSPTVQVQKNCKKKILRFHKINLMFLVLSQIFLEKPLNFSNHNMFHPLLLHEHHTYNLNTKTCWNVAIRLYKCLHATSLPTTWTLKRLKIKKWSTQKSA